MFFRRKKTFIFQFSAGKWPEAIDTTYVDPVYPTDVPKNFLAQTDHKKKILSQKVQGGGQK